MARKTDMSGLSRRDVVKLGSAAAAFGIGFPAVLRAQPKEVVMLGLWSFTGAFSDVGPVLDRGMKLALEERGMKVQGKTIKYITRDDETKAGSATRRRGGRRLRRCKVHHRAVVVGRRAGCLGGREAQEGIP